MDNWSNLYITDKSGRKLWNTTASPMSTQSEIRNLKRHLETVIRFSLMNPACPMVDVPTAVIMVDGEPLVEMTDDELLTELMA